MAIKPDSIGEMAGRVVGAVLAPLFAAGSLLRQARIFHPEGVCYCATVEALTTTPELAPVAQRLAGHALVRLSSALWRGGKEWPDVLGCTIRFGESEVITTEAPADAQDVLLASSPRVLILPLAPLWSDPHDFLDNTYYGMAPFEIEGVGLVRLELVPPAVVENSGRNRLERLDHAVAAGRAVFVLRVQHCIGSPEWISVVEIRLEQRLSLDQEALRFSPFRDGRGIRPRGFVQAMRRAVYELSQRARPRA